MFINEEFNFGDNRFNDGDNRPAILAPNDGDLLRFDDKGGVGGVVGVVGNRSQFLFLEFSSFGPVK